VAVVRDLYANSLAYADAQLGTVVAALHASHRWDSTLVVILGDHGEAFYEHDLPAHGNALFQELTRVPLVVRVPGQTARVDSLPAASIDVPPTVLGALGLPPHPAFQGIDLGDSVGRRHRPEFLLVKTPMRHAAGIVQDGAKLIVDTRTGDATMYDLRRDPGEHHPLDPAWTARGRALNASLTAWWNAQLAYYASPSAKRHFYAPAIVPAAHDRPLPTPSSSGVVRQPVARAASG
jgi:arylsulfatase A-like enzyme